MSGKNITITTEDSVGIQDKSNMDKPKMIHEQVFEQYGIDPQKVFERTGMLKTIPHEWIPDIIESNINSIKIPKLKLTNNRKDKVVSVVFESEELRKTFYDLFGRNMAISINGFITKQNEDPKKYNRIIVIETTEEDNQLSIRY